MKKISQLKATLEENKTPAQLKEQDIKEGKQAKFNKKGYATPQTSVSFNPSNTGGKGTVSVSLGTGSFAKSFTVSFYDLNQALYGELRGLIKADDNDADEGFIVGTLQKGKYISAHIYEGQGGDKYNTVVAELKRLEDREKSGKVSSKLKPLHLNKTAAGMKDNYIKILEEGYKPEEVKKYLTDVSKPNADPSKVKEPKPKMSAAETMEQDLATASSEIDLAL